MIIKEENLQNNIYSNLLDCIPILEETISPRMVPILENYTLNEYMVNFKDLYRYADQSNKTFQEAFYDIKNENKLDYLYISIDEALIYDNPQLLNEFNNLLLIPQNKNSKAYKFLEMCMLEYMQSGDIKYIDYFLEADDATLKQYEQKLMRQKIAFENTRKQLSAMKQGDKKYQIANNRLMGMQQAIDNTTKMIDELKRRGSISQQGSRDERLAAYKQAKADASKTTNDMINNPGTIPTKPTKVKPIKPAPSSTIGSAPPSTVKPIETNPSSNPSSPNNTNNKPSWFSQKWGAFKNWMNNLNNTEDKQSTWFSDLIGNIKGWFNGNKQQATAESVFFEDRRMPPKPQKPSPTQRISPIPSNQISNNNPYKPTDPISQGPIANKLSGQKNTVRQNNAGQNFNQPQQPIQASADIDFFINEVYRPRRLYRHRYLR